jgi:hypothetical protein
MLPNGAAQIQETATQFPQFALLHSVTCVQLRLITILGNCVCQFPQCVPGLTVKVAGSLLNLGPRCRTSLGTVTALRHKDRHATEQASRSGSRIATFSSDFLRQCPYYIEEIRFEVITAAIMNAVQSVES